MTDGTMDDDQLPERFQWLAGAGSWDELATMVDGDTADARLSRDLVHSRMWIRSKVIAGDNDVIDFIDKFMDENSGMIPNPIDVCRHFGVGRP